LREDLTNMSDLQAFQAATVSAFESDPFASDTIPSPEIEDDDPTLVMPARELAELRKIATPATPVTPVRPMARPATPPKPFLTLRDCPAAKAKVELRLDLEGI
jgi:hypothetical protein